jgi:hypothetical protein
MVERDRKARCSDAVNTATGSVHEQSGRSGDSCLKELYMVWLVPVCTHMLIYNTSSRPYILRSEKLVWPCLSSLSLAEKSVRGVGKFLINSIQPAIILVCRLLAEGWANTCLLSNQSNRSFASVCGTSKCHIYIG